MDKLRWPIFFGVMGFCVAYVLWGNAPRETNLPVLPPQHTPATGAANTGADATQAKPPVTTTVADTHKPPVPQPQPNLQPVIGLNGATALKLDPPKPDFGEVPANQTKEQIFTLTNSSDRPIEILALKASCGCLSFELLEKTVPPKSQVPLKLKFTGIPGKKSDTVSLSFDTDEPNKPAVIIKVHGQTRADFIVEPDIVQFMQVARGGSYTKTVTVKTAHGEPFIIKSLISPRPEITVRELPDEGETMPAAAGVTIRRVEVKFTAAKGGNFNGNGGIVTDHPDSKVLPLPIAASVAFDLSSSPAVVRSVKDAAGMVEPFDFTVNRKSPGPLQVLGVKEQTGIAIDWKSEPAGEGAVKIHLTMTGPYAKRAPFGYFQVKTSVEDEEYSVPYRVMPKSN